MDLIQFSDGEKALLKHAQHDARAAIAVRGRGIGRDDAHPLGRGARLDQVVAHRDQLRLIDRPDRLDAHLAQLGVMDQ